MIIIVGHSRDGDVRDLARHLDAIVLTPGDLASPGWILPFPRWEEGLAVIGGVPIPVGEISAIVIRISRVAQSDLTCVRQSDRGFAAREIQALLYAWLSQCRTLVVNRPSILSLSGEAAFSAAMPGWLTVANRRLPAERRLSISIIAGQIVEFYSSSPLTIGLVQRDGLTDELGSWATTPETPVAAIELQTVDRDHWEVIEVHTLPRLKSRHARDALARYLQCRLTRTEYG